VQGEFASVVQKVLFEEGDKAKLAEYFNHLQTLIINEALRNDLAFIYNFENGRMLYNKAKFKESVPYMETALKIKPKHDDATRLLIATIAQSFRNTPNKEVMQLLEGYAQKFPELMENNFFLEMLGSAYLSEIQFRFEMGNNIEGEKYRAIFETFQKDHSEVTYDSYLVGRTYSAASVYYFKKNQTSKAKQILAKGLQISPNNYELISRQRMIN
jgi:tetratricopeptide (TPR) repeat protein